MENEEKTKAEEEITASPRRKTSVSTVLMWIAAAALVAVIVFCAVKVGMDLAERARAKRIYGAPELEVIGSRLDAGDGEFVPLWTREPSDEVTDEPGDVTVPDYPFEEMPEPDYSERFNEIRNDILELKEKYPDVIGYIMIEELGIKYPLVQRLSDKEQTYYLMRTYDGKINRAGAIFMDIRCSDYLDINANTVIYGHNMKDGQMFGNLYILLNYSERFERAEIVVATLDGIYTYKVFSGYRTDTEHNYINTDFHTEEEYLSFLEDAKRRSTVKSGVELSSSDRIITLSTCTNGDENGRFAIHGVLTEISH